MSSKPSFPWRLSIPGIPLVLAGLPFFFEQWGNQQPWWNAMPWLTLLLIAVAFFAGAIYADITDDNSDIRAWWRGRIRLFDPAFHPASEIREGVDLSTPRFSLKFVRRAKNLTIELMLYENVQFSINKSPILIAKIGPANYVDGETILVPIAHIQRRKAHPNYWGTNPEKGILGRSGNLLEVRATKPRRFFPIIQTYAVFISFGECDDETHNRYFYLQEDRDVFSR